MKKMSKLKIVAPLMVMISVFPLFSEEQGQLDPEILRQVQDILSQPVKTYRIDKAGTRESLKRLDEWILRNTGLDTVQPVKAKDLDRWVYKRLVKKNSPLLVNPGQKGGIRVKNPFTVRYEREGLERSFRKDIRMPTKKRLTDAQVIELGRRFVLDNQFARESKVDKMARPLVAAWRTHRLEENIKEEEKRTVLHRVIFHRNFKGLKVINSRIMVDFHPDSEEVLSFKHFGWNSILEKPVVSHGYKSLKILLKEIASAMKEHKGHQKIRKISQQLFQSSDHLIPVLVLDIALEAEDEKGDCRSTLLVINLLKEFSIDRETEPLKLPEKRSKRIN